jgi:hypothetical protein
MRTPRAQAEMATLRRYHTLSDTGLSSPRRNGMAKKDVIFFEKKEPKNFCTSVAG